MENALGVSLLDERYCLQQGLLGPFDILLLNGCFHFLYRRLHSGFDLEVSEPPFFILS